MLFIEEMTLVLLHQQRRLTMNKIFFIFLLIFSSTAIHAQPDVPFGIRHYETGMAKNFELSDIDGEKFSLDQTRGQWVFLHFWATWCGPCREEMPTIQKLTEIMSGEKLHFVLVNMAEEEDDVFTFMSGIDVDINSLLDRDGLVTEIWKPRGLPTTFLIDPQGQVRYQAIGGRDWDQPAYTKFLKALLISPR